MNFNFKVSTLTFCDLAGSGGLRMTKNSQRMKESRSINASLLVLGRCLKTIQRNSILRNNTGPFRESNLTRYLQNPLSGRENLIILVNLNKSPELYVETQNVLNFFSTLNNKIIIGENLKNKSTILSRSSTWISSEKILSSNTPIKLIINSPKMKMEKLKNENKLLLEELLELKNNNFKKESKIRQELNEIYLLKMNDLEMDWRKKNDELNEEREDLLKWSVKQVDDYYKERINNMTNRKRKRLNNHDGHGDFEESTIEYLEEENFKATTKIIALDEIVENLKKKNLELNIKKSELIFELSITKKELDDIKIKFQNEIKNSFNEHRESFHFENLTETNELKNEINKKNEEINQLKFKLNEMNQELLKIKNFNENSNLKHFSINDSINELSIDDKNLNSHLHNVSLSPISMDKISIIEEENLETSHISLRTLITVPILETLDFSSEENRLSFLDSSIEKSEKSLRISDDDSGIRTSSNSSELNKKIFENNDKSIQVDFNDLEKIKLKIKSLKYEYKKLGDNYLNKSNKLDDYQREMEKFKNLIYKLETNSIIDYKQLEEYEILLASKDNDLKRLDLDKKELSTKYNKMFENWKEKINDYEKKFENNFINEEISILPDDLENYIEKFVNLGNQIKIDQAQLEQKIITEHVPKIRKLEQELIEKNLIIIDLNKEISEMKIDMKKIDQIHEKVLKFLFIYIFF